MVWTRPTTTRADVWLRLWLRECRCERTQNRPTLVNSRIVMCETINAQQCCCCWRDIYLYWLLLVRVRLTYHKEDWTRNCLDFITMGLNHAGCCINCINILLEFRINVIQLLQLYTIQTDWHLTSFIKINR